MQRQWREGVLIKSNFNEWKKTDMSTYICESYNNFIMQENEMIYVYIFRGVSAHVWRHPKKVDICHAFVEFY